MKELYVLMLSLHGLIRGNDMELGCDADTGGQVLYVVELMRALARQPQVGKVDLLTRRIEDPSVSADYARPEETLANNARIIRLQCGPRRYLRKESLWPYLGQLVDRALPKPGTGPSERAREQGSYAVETYTTTTSGARYRCSMSQKGDFGYKATSVLLGESGLALALDRDRLSDLRGVLTPAAAMGDVLLARFPGAGVTLETVRLN